MKAKKGKGDNYMSAVKVGAKGQIVIPKEIRDMFDINPGDKLLILADAKKGIALERFEVFSKIADMIFSGNAKKVYPDHSEQDSINFASAIKDIGENGEDDENGDTDN